jgi:PAS domain S-box-containing protein
MASDFSAKGQKKVFGSNLKQDNLFLDKMLDGFAYHKIVVNKSGRPIDYVFLEINHAFEKMTGLKRKQIIGKKVTEVLPGIEKDPADWIGVYGKVAITGEPVQFENHAIPLAKWYKVSAYCPEKGYFVALFEDITERKKSEQELWQAKKDWERTFDSVPDLVAILDNQYRIVRANRAMAQKLGVTREKAVGLLCYKCVHGLDSPPDFCPHTQTVKDGKQHQAEVTEPRLGGDFLVTTTPLKDEKGDMIGSVHVARNITEIKQREHEIENISKFPSENPNPIFRIDKKGTILYGNTACDSLFSMWNTKVGKRTPELVSKAVANVLRSNEGVELEVTLRSRTLSLLLVPFALEGYVNVYASDITNRKKAEEALRESEQRWATTLASIGDAVIATDTSGKIMFMNSEAEKLTGWKLHDATQKPVKTVFNIVNEQTRLDVENPIHKVLEKGIVVGLANHTVLIRKDSSEIPIDDSGAPIKNKDGKTTGVVLIFRDISERKKAEEAMVYQDKLLSRAREAIYGVDSKFHINYWNKGSEGLFGYSKEEALGKNFQELIPIKIDNSTRTEELAKMETIGYWEGEVQYRRKNGSYVAVELNSSTFKGPEGELLGVVTAARDITERKKIEEAIARQAELIDLSPDAIIVRKLDGTISFWSKGAENLYGWTKEEAIGCNINNLLKTEFPVPPKEIQNRLEQDGKWSGEIAHTCANGNKIVVQSYWLGKFGADGKIFELLESNVDITPRILMQTKVEESAVMVEEYANQMETLATKRAEQLKDAERLAAIGATAGMVGHDIRNPLQAITGDVYLAKLELSSTTESEEKKNALESLAEIQKNIDYINKIVADLQDFARPLKPILEETDLKPIIDDLLKKNGLPKNVKVTVKVEADARKIVADSSYLNRIMYNLVNNAVQAMPKGGKLTINAYKEENDTLISVKDTGVGIPESVKEKLFTPMFTTKSKGQGFGLAVIKRMTEALGGTVTFESQEGKGTTFTICLPPQNQVRKRNFK